MGEVADTAVGDRLKGMATSGALLAIMAWVGPLYAQAGVAPHVAASPTDDARREAHERYEEGKAAFAAGDYLRAARLFLETYRLAPHHDALWNAARSFDLGGEPVRAANLYARYLDVAPADARDRDRATTSRRNLAAVLARIDLQGAAEQITVDGEIAVIATVYVAPGQHVVRGVVAGRVVERLVTVGTGATLSVALTAPDPAAEPVVTRPLASAPLPEGSTWPRPFPRAVVYVGAGLTAVAVGFTIASGVDTLNAKSAYQAAPSSALLSDGESKQDRTNALFWTSVGVGVTTAALGLLFVDWGHAVRAVAGPGTLKVAGVF